MSKQHKGLYIALEGGDGSGKGTQAKVLVEKLESLGYNVLTVSYPQYGRPSARYVERYLRGEYGEANDISADLAALTYIVNRLDFESVQSLRAHLSAPGNIVVADRSPASNMAHQGTKISNKAKRQDFYREIAELEYDVLNLPKPDMSIILRANPEIAQQNVDKKDASTHSYTSSKRDIHEADINHLRLAFRNYDELCEALPNEFLSIDALDSAGKMLPIDEVHAEIMKITTPYLYLSSE